MRWVAFKMELRGKICVGLELESVAVSLIEGALEESTLRGSLFV